MAEKEKKKRGRPKVEIDLELAENLGKIQCTYSEVSAVMGIPEGTLKTREDFSTAFKRGKENGKASLRRMQFKLAERHAGMAIFLGKNYLGQKDDRNHDPNRPVAVDFKFEVVSDAD